eukprot:c20904_g1_i1 orf=324-1010(-)
MLCTIWRARISAWFQRYENLQSLAVVLLYAQVVFALIGSLGALYTGVLVVNLSVALFALVAVESGSQTLGRTYAVLLASALALDIAWFVLFSVEIRRTDWKTIFAKLSVFSIQLVFWMQIGGFAVRFFSAFLWLQMYRLGASTDHGYLYQPIDFEGRIGITGFFTPGSSPRTTPRQSSLGEEVLGGSIYNPTYYASLFRPPHDSVSAGEVEEETGSFNESYISIHEFE